MKLSKFKNKTAFKRTVAFVTSLTMLASSMCFPEISDDIKGIFNITTANAEVSTVTNLTKGSLRELYEFSAEYNAHPENYSRLNLTIDLGDNNDISSTKIFGDDTLTWYPLGTKEHPFDGRIVVKITNGTVQPIVANAPLFGYVADSVEIVNFNDYSSRQELILYREEDDDSPLFAEHVVHDSNSSSTLSTWNIDVAADHSYGGIIGDVGKDSANTNVHLNLKLVESAAVSTSGNAGLVCGTIYDNSTVNVNFLPSSSETSVNVTSTGGNAGSFVGEMKPSSTINFFPGNYIVSNSSRSVSAKTYAGGLVGKNDQGTVKIIDFEKDGNGDPVTDANGAYKYLVQKDENDEPVTDENGEYV